MREPFLAATNLIITAAQRVAVRDHAIQRLVLGADGIVPLIAAKVAVCSTYKFPKEYADRVALLLNGVADPAILGFDESVHPSKLAAHLKEYNSL